MLRCQLPTTKGPVRECGSMYTQNRLSGNRWLAPCVASRNYKFGFAQFCWRGDKTRTHWQACNGVDTTSHFESFSFEYIVCTTLTALQILLFVHVAECARKAVFVVTGQ